MMSILFSISVGKKNYKFESVTAMEDFIFKNQKLLKDCSIILKDEQGKQTGCIKVSSYIKINKKCSGSLAKSLK
jgi:hypothetical protein